MNFSLQSTPVMIRFTPFQDYRSIEEIDHVLDCIFSHPDQLPTLQISVNTLLDQEPSGFATYHTPTLTQHVSFMLAQPLSTCVWNAESSEDGTWRYSYAYLKFPMALRDTSFVPCYTYICGRPARPAHWSATNESIKQWNSEFLAFFRDKSRHAVLQEDVCLAPKYLFWEQEQRDRKPLESKARESALAYRLALPGSQVIAVTKRHSEIEDLEIPMIHLKILYREHEKLQAHVCRINENSLHTEG